ncbi:MAG TPA: NADP-specific glutamate dehydrogenase, partial [Treponemataceae bacterium]|nr:NADP-specific glutamate dehydrogenase [Treponemataceae bacterium]HQF73693.1 NADP-specific glutamate dehydrogenase [Treponemataceae bacterium]
FVMELKNVKRGRISEYAKKYTGATYTEGKRPWGVPVDCAFPCATQNEISGEEAAALVKGGCKLVAEGANMPSTPEAVEVFQKNGVLFAPGKASNAGGVATSGLEMSQNSMRLSWSREEVDTKLKGIMKSIHDNAYAASKEFGKEGDYVAGANIAGFLKVAKTMIAHGVV